MKKAGLSLFCSTLTAVLLMASFFSARANPVGSPTVTTLSGDQQFTADIVPIDKLPGAAALPNGMLIPAGFPPGEKQFEGEGVRVSGLDYGSALACFSISGVQFGWGGQVGRWNGARWILLPTTVTRKEESLTADACASIKTDGTYALIRWIVDRSLPLSAKETGIPEPTFVLSQTPWYTPSVTTTSNPPQPTGTELFQGTATETRTPTGTLPVSPTETNTSTPTDTDTPTPTNTNTSTPTDTDTPTPTNTRTSTPTDTETSTPTDTHTPTPADTDTPTPTNTHTATSTSTNTSSPTPTFTLTPTQALSSLTFVPVADAYAREASPNTNYGSNVQLWVQSLTGANYQSYVKFTVSGVVGTVQKATLRVYSISLTSDGPAVYTSRTNWTETGVKWNNRPNITSSGFDDKGALAQNAWVEFDVTSLVAGNGTFSFALLASSFNASSFSSREGTNPPQLVVEFGP